MGKKGKSKAKVTEESAIEQEAKPLQEEPLSPMPSKDKSSSSKSKDFTWKEIGEHSYADDSWIVIAGTVYDLSRYALDHPEAAKRVQHRAGKDATKSFHHCQHSIDVWLQYKLGVVHEGSMVGSWQRENSTGRMDAFVAIVLTVVLVGFMGYMIR